jgi:hypothetical protein
MLEMFKRKRLCEFCIMALKFLHLTTDTESLKTIDRYRCFQLPDLYIAISMEKTK